MLKKVLKKIIPIKYHWLLYNKFRNLFGWRSKSYSSFGEDIVVSKLAKDKRNGFYVDVGAFHPFKYSNTYYLKKYYGWRGINIEPNPDNFELFKRKRKDDININIGVASSNATLSYYMFSDPLYNTFSKERSHELAEQGMKPIKIKKIMVTPLKEVLEKHLSTNQIDFLNVDVEMYDLEVLKSIDWSITKPSIVAIEDHQMKLDTLSESPIYLFLKEKGYELNSKCHFTTIYKLS